MDIGFIIKKTITFFVEPLGFILLLSSFGLYFLFINKTKYAKIFLSLSFSFLVLLSYPPFSNFLVEKLENQYKKYQYNEDIKYIHVLGGGHNNDTSQPLSSKLGDASTKRVLEGIIIYKNIPGTKLIFTGYEGNTNISTAQMNANLAIALGIPEKDIIINGLPKDTYEEAEFSKHIVKDKKFALVTSATHMPRAMMMFKSKGMNPISAPTYFKKKDIYKHLPSTSSFENSRMAIHEYLGILWAKLRG
ncbi:MAG: YdcF family protein [Thiovulaceae bacterium]|nr:YdcF family protein [Sulfurimonadaceae bacterium]